MARSRLLAAVILSTACAGTPSEPPRGAADARDYILRVNVPDGTPDSVFVAGTFNRWNPADAAYRLAREPAGTYAIVLPDSVRGAVEFKFTLGSWERVETNGAGGDVPNRTAVVGDSGGAYVSGVAGWRDPADVEPRVSTAGPGVSVLDTAFAIPQLGRTRRVWLYLPPDYHTSEKTYPVLYMHDGQNVFDDATSYVGEWGVDETLDSLHAAGDWGAIVVAVDHGAHLRLDEYSPWRNARHGGGEGAAYVDFLVHTLKPYIDANYRTRVDRLSTGIAGSSMGGLISLYAMLKYPEVFGRAGVFSPAFWFAPEVYDFAAAARPVRPDPRIYVISGALEGAPGESAGVYVRDQERMVEVLREASFRLGEELVAHVRDDGQHSEWFWRREFPAAYQWLFRRE